MPFDSTPSKTITHPSVEGLIAWLETQPGETVYNFYYGCDCLNARYYKAHGLEYRVCDNLTLETIAAPSDAGETATYAEALDYARSLVEQG